jgi:hypothetical protein
LGIFTDSILSVADSPELQFERGILCLAPAFDLNMRHAIGLATIDEATLQSFYAEPERDLVGVGRLAVLFHMALLVDDGRDDGEVCRVDNGVELIQALKCLDSFRLCAW